MVGIRIGCEDPVRIGNRAGIGAAAAVVCLIWWSGGAFAAGDAAKGRDLAATWCSSCHQIHRSLPAHPERASFMDIAKNARYSDQYIRDWVTHTPPPMPRFRLPPKQVDDLIAYFHSLRIDNAVEPSDYPLAGDISGSGFYVGPDGHVLTAAHVVRGCRRTSVETPGAQSNEAQVIATEAESDLALLRVDVRPPAFASFDPDVQVEVGESLAAYGFPLTGTLASAGTLSVGHVAALSGVHDNGSRFQMSVDLQPGSSGGPVLDATGAVVGVAVTRLKSTSSASGFVPGVNFAVGGYNIQSFLARSGIVGNFYLARAHMPLQRVAQLARSFTVRVSCRR